MSEDVKIEASVREEPTHSGPGYLVSLLIGGLEFRGMRYWPTRDRAEAVARQIGTLIEDAVASERERIAVLCDEAAAAADREPARDPVAIGIALGRGRAAAELAEVLRSAAKQEGE